MKHVRSKNATIETLESLTLMSASTVEGTAAGEWINGDAGDNTILAGGGNDEIYAPLGDNIIDGGSGVDSVLVYGGLKADYSLEAAGDGAFVMRGSDLHGGTAVNVLRSVEHIIFDDAVVNLATLEAPAEPTQVPTEFFEPPMEMLEAPDTQEVAFTAQDVAATRTFATSLAAPVPEADFMTRVLELTNDIRRQNGLSDLSLNNQLQQAAQVHSANMAGQDFFSHYGLDGTMPWDRGENAGYDYRFYGENIAAGQTTPETVVQAWVDSPSHLANILNANYSEIGVGYTYLQNDSGNVNYNHYWAQEFGTQR